MTKNHIDPPLPTKNKQARLLHASQSTPYQPPIFLLKGLTLLLQLVMALERSLDPNTSSSPTTTIETRDPTLSMPINSRQRLGPY